MSEGLCCHWWSNSHPSHTIMMDVKINLLTFYVCMITMMTFHVAVIQENT